MDGRRLKGPSTADDGGRLVDLDRSTDGRGANGGRRVGTPIDG